MPVELTEEQGEELHKLGELGTRRAKVWLDSTSRVSSSWTVYDAAAVKRLRFSWPVDGFKPFSFDLGGILAGGEFEQQAFIAECKKYSTKSQGGHYDKFLAQSYVLMQDDSALADHIFWITWHPFRIDTWNVLASEAKVEAAVSKWASRIFPGYADKSDISAVIDKDAVARVAQRVWNLVLTDRQEKLVLAPNDRALVIAERIKRGEA